MSQSAAWVAVTLDAIADSDSASNHDSLDLRQAATFIREHEDEFDEQCIEGDLGRTVAIAPVASFTTRHQENLQAMPEEVGKVNDEAAGEE